MVTSFNRLEKLFSKRKASAPTSEPLTRVSSVPESTEQQFPSPSFIRPKGNRMAAREEFRSKQSPTRSPSVPDLLMSQRQILIHSRNSSSTSSSPRQKLSATRSASFRSPKRDPFVLILNEFQFPEPPTYNGDTSPLSLTFSAQYRPDSAKSIPESHHQSSPRRRSPLDLSIPSSRIDTPPSSDPGDEETSPCTYYAKKLPALPPHRAPPTPDESPEFGPIPDSKLRTSKSVDVLDKALYKAIHIQLGESFEDSEVLKSQPHLNLLPSARFSYCSSTLREPDFDDFLELSDDDIAESEPDSSILSPSQDIAPFLPAMSLSIPAPSPWAPSLLTLAPPVASRAATAAAFEAARIANRYDFDLVYVVNLWPTNEYTSQTLSPPSIQHGPATAQRPMMGRLMAAHGLHHVPSPLQISAGVHCKVLRSEGWVEYRNEKAQSGEHARGYACPFYPGEYSRKGSIGSDAPVSGVRLSERIDRGIVFAAFRGPRAGGSRLGATLEKEDLGRLHNDAEALVEMLIDIHATSQLRQCYSMDQLSDNIGPIPPNNVNLA